MLRLSPILRASQPAAREFLVVSEVVGLLKKYPQINYERRDDSVLVPPATPEGFAVTIEQIWEGHFAVSYGGWQKDFDILEEAVDCFLMGLSNRCRLKVESKGSKPVRWTLEQLEEQNWREVSSRGSWSARLFKQPEVSYLQNDLLAPRDVQVREEAPVGPSGMAL